MLSLNSPIPVYITVGSTDGYKTYFLISMMELINERSGDVDDGDMLLGVIGLNVIGSPSYLIPSATADALINSGETSDASWSERHSLRKITVCKGLNSGGTTGTLFCSSLPIIGENLDMTVTS